MILHIDSVCRYQDRSDRLEDAPVSSNLTTLGYDSAARPEFFFQWLFGGSTPFVLFFTLFHLFCGVRATSFTVSLSHILVNNPACTLIAWGYARLAVSAEIPYLSQDTTSAAILPDWRRRGSALQWIADLPVL